MTKQSTGRLPGWLNRSAVIQAIARRRLRDAGKLKTQQPTRDEQAKWRERYGHDLIGFCERVLGMTPWKGVNGHPGQYEILQAIQESVTRQLAGEQAVPYVFVIEAAHGVGKTYGIGAPVMIWFYRCFGPCVVQSTANTNDQVRDTLWKNIRMHVASALMRRRNVMPGLMPKDMRAEQSADHFAMGFVTNDAGGTGTERVQGQHNDFHLWVFEEAEGIAEFMYDAAKRQFTGNTVRLWLLYANPKTSTSAFQEMMRHPLAQVFRLSLINFPNVWNGTSEVPGGTMRSVFNEMIEDQRTFGCEVVPKMDEARHTFVVPWDVPKAGGGFHPAGTVFAPKRGFLYGALGIPPTGGGGDTFISAGRFDACVTREVTPVPDFQVMPPLGLGLTVQDLFPHLDPTTLDPGITHRAQGHEVRVIWSAQIGVDCGRYGDDAGTIYSLARRILRFEEAIQGAQELDAMTRTDRYVQAVAKAARRLAAQGITRLSIRVDAGYGSGIIDGLRKLEELAALFPDGYVVHEVPFGSAATDGDQYANLVTEMYAQADEVLSVVRIEHPPLLLKRDLTERKYGYVTRGDRDVRQLEKKQVFKKRSKGQSPDDGDGAVLALAPERLFKDRTPDLTSAIAALAELELDDLN
ncbi:hypothetical protein [Deinococcus multiflagellatus]|uniref:Terminase n=1 Tax=Deinococcus multiflagellatus TaxID=1656887 RepID=A0ABW1ZI38_9DEIO|nr:hypothetical protein [Deinococcus multiflagellatus]MBZ9713761.1 hypothetical protein [Deinococcus multiflagellatus]